MEGLLKLFKYYIAFHDIMHKDTLKLNYLAETFPTQYSKQLNTYILNEAKTQKRLDEQAKPLQVPMINHEVYYIFNASQYSHLSCNSYIFYIDGKIIKTPKTTRDLLRQYMKKESISYDWLKVLGSYANVYQKVPIIFGNCFFAPTGGTSKGLTDWYGIHHLMHVEKTDQGTLLSFRNQNELIVSDSKETVEKMIERTDRLERMNTRIAWQVVNEILLCMKNKSCGNVIEQRRNRYQEEIDYPVGEELLQEVVEHRSEQLLKKILGEDNPYLEALEKEIKKRKQI